MQTHFKLACLFLFISACANPTPPARPTPSVEETNQNRAITTNPISNSNTVQNNTVNTKPSITGITIPPSVNAGGILIVTALARDIDVGDTLTYSIDLGQQFAKQTNNSGVFQVSIPETAASVTMPIRVTATDSHGNFDYRDLTFAIISTPSGGTVGQVGKAISTKCDAIEDTILKSLCEITGAGAQIISK